MIGVKLYEGRSICQWPEKIRCHRKYLNQCISMLQCNLTEFLRYYVSSDLKLVFIIIRQKLKSSRRCGLVVRLWPQTVTVAYYALLLNQFDVIMTKNWSTLFPIWVFYIFYNENLIGVKRQSWNEQVTAATDEYFERFQKLLVGAQKEAWG